VILKGVEFFGQAHLLNGLRVSHIRESVGSG
jgi:hypothetical protein